MCLVQRKVILLTRFGGTIIFFLIFKLSLHLRIGDLYREKTSSSENVIFKIMIVPKCW